MGRVYLGRSPGGRQVAIKVIRTELAEDADFRARFAREVSAARKVSGIFTAPVVDADLDGPVPWLATSYIAGPSLAHAVAGRGPLPAASVQRLAAGLAEGLVAIHAAGVVHRDLKPSNVLLAEDGPRLIDFGISRSLETGALTRTGTVIGSPGFMSPEQAEGRDCGPPSDIFSLGAVLTFAATGAGPFGEGTTVALLYRVVRSEPNTAGLPGEIRPLIEGCLAKDPRQRPTAAQLLAALSATPPVAHPWPEPAAQGYGPVGQASYGAAAAMPAQAHPATERAAPPASPPGYLAEGAPAPSRPEPHPVYDERVTETQRRWDQPTGEPGRQWDRPAEPGRQWDRPAEPGRQWDRPAEPGRQWDRPAAEPEPAWERPVAQPVPPWDGRAAGPVRRQPPRRGWLIAGAAAAVLASVGAGVLLAGKVGHPGHSALAASGSSVQVSSASPVTSPPANSSTPSSTPAQLPGAAAMTTLGSDLAQSASVRPTVQPAIDAVESCSESPATGEATLQQAITTRQNILNGLQVLSVTGLPNGGQLISNLSTAMQDSIQADKYYQSWMQDFASSGSPCGSDQNQDSNYVAGQNASAAATVAKNAFVDIWDPMAPRYGQQPYSSNGF
jgi:hypothetical protein